MPLQPALLWSRLSAVSQGRDPGGPRGAGPGPWGQSAVRAGRSGGQRTERGNPGPEPRPAGRSGGVTGRGRGIPVRPRHGPARGSDRARPCRRCHRPPGPALPRPGRARRGCEARAAPGSPRPAAPAAGPPSGSRPPCRPLPARRGPGGSAALSQAGRQPSPTPAASPAFPQSQPALRSWRGPARPCLQRRGAAGENLDWALSSSRLPPLRLAERLPSLCSILL